MRRVLVLIGFVALCLAAGGLGGWLTADSARTWYPTIAKPGWTPPGWVFGPVWTILYVLMGVAAFLVWRRHRSPRRSLALVLFVGQLLLNVLWTAVFFGMHEIGYAAVEIVILWATLLATTITFFLVSKAAGWLMMPYLLWVTFAAVLNIAIWQMNRGDAGEVEAANEEVTDAGTPASEASGTDDPRSPAARR